MSIQSQEDVLRLSGVGKVVGVALREMRAAVRPGIATAELDAIAGKVLERYGARSAT